MIGNKEDGKKKARPSKTEDRAPELIERLKRDFIAHKRRERWRRVPSTQADTFAPVRNPGRNHRAGANVEENALAHRARDDGCWSRGGRVKERPLECV